MFNGFVIKSILNIQDANGSERITVFKCSFTNVCDTIWYYNVIQTFTTTESPISNGYKTIRNFYGSKIHAIIESILGDVCNTLFYNDNFDIGFIFPPRKLIKISLTFNSQGSSCVFEMVCCVLTALPFFVCICN